MTVSDLMPFLNAVLYTALIVTFVVMRAKHVRWLKAVADYAYRLESARKRYAEAADVPPPPKAPPIVAQFRPDSVHAVGEALAQMQGDAEVVAAVLRRAVSPALCVDRHTVEGILKAAKRRHAIPRLDAPTLADAP